MEIVSFELAKKLKEKGFNEDCYTVYNTATRRIERSLTTWKGYKGVILAPTISQVLKWLREEKGMYIQITLFEYCYDYCILDTKMVYYDNEHKVLHQGPTGYSYEEAALAGIEYVIDNLI